MIRRQLFSDEPKAHVNSDDIYRICIETKQDIETSRRMMIDRFDQIDDGLLDIKGSIREMQAFIISKLDSMFGIQDTILKVVIIESL